MPPLSRIVFFGTPHFAVPTLETLLASGRRPLLVVTQPSRPVGRGQRVQPPPVALVAEREGIPLAQPQRVKEAAFLATLAALDPELAVVVAFGQIFPKKLLELPRHGCINVHASLLPAYRGAAPIQAALAAGDAVTGVTTMRMDEGMDTGPMLLRESLAIGPRETAEELAGRLATLGGELLVRTLEALEAGTLEAQPQLQEGVSYAPRIRKEDGRVDWRRSAEEISHLLRALTPWPGLTASLAGVPVKLLAAVPVGPVAQVSPGSTGSAGSTGSTGSMGKGPGPGTVLGLRDGCLHIVCSGGSVLAVERLQKAGKRALSAADFANGERLQAGTAFD